MDVHAKNAANEVVRRLFDEGILDELTVYDDAVEWIAKIIETEYNDAPIVFPEKVDPSSETILDAILEFGEGDNGSERLREY